MLFFVDESGIGNAGAGSPPYVVLASVSIREDKFWPLVLAQREMKARFLTSFDPAQTDPLESQEPKASDLLKLQAFRLAGARPWFSDAEIERLVQQARAKHRQHLTPDELRGANQGKIRYVEELLQLCRLADIRVFATVTTRAAPTAGDGTFLSKDFSFLFQRIYAYLDQQAAGQHGLLVFDERDEGFSRKLVGQMHRYFTGTATGKARASRIVPTPFFAKSYLMPAVQVADKVAYVINWAFRVGPINAPRREEMVYLALKVRQMQFEGTRVDRFAVTELPLWGIQYIDDLRPQREQRDVEEAD